MTKIFDVFNKIPKIFLIVILCSGILWNFKPDGLSAEGWHLLIIFVSTIITILTSPMPLGTIAFLSLTATVSTGILTVSEALSGFNSKIVWLILSAMFISGAITKSGLGKRIAYFLICKSKNSLISLSYTLILCELILSPVIPSAVARGGGIVYPILSSVIEVLDRNAQKKNVKFFLVQVCFYSSVITSAITLTAMAANPLVVSIANKFGIDMTWNTWFIAAIIPGLANLILIPLMLYYILKPADIDIRKVKNYAQKQLASLKSFSREEFLITITLIGLIILWILGDFLGISATKTILIGLSILLVTGVIPWDDVITNKTAWGLLIWFSTLLMLSGFLVKFNAIYWISEQIKYFINDIDTKFVVPVLFVLFFYLHYFFVSTTAYITTLFAPFLMILLNFNMPGNISVMSLAILAIISGGFTHYSFAVAPRYFSRSGVEVSRWCKLGFLVSTANILIWFGVCCLWWKIIGWY